MKRSIRRMAMALAATGLLAGMAGRAEAGNILVNPGFESGSLSPWFANNGAPTVTSAEAHTGTYSVAAISNDEPRQNFAPVASSAITEVSFWVKRVGGPFDFVEFFYSDSTQAGFLISGSSSDWTFFNVTSHLDLSKSLSGIGVYGTSPGPAYLDDFTVDVNVAAVPEPATLALAGFGTLIGVGRWLGRRKARATA